MENNRKRVIALGFFDGVHLGHQALLRRAMERSRERGLTPAMVTFDRSPREFVTGRRSGDGRRRRSFRGWRWWSSPSTGP